MKEHPVILAVDDTPAILTILCSILSQCGYQCLMAGSGERAFEIVENILPDLILLDINMPGMSGLEVCRRLKAESRTKDIPVIFISADYETETQVAGFKCGAIDFVIKPFESEILLLRVRTHLELNFLRRQAGERVEELERTQALLQAEMDARNVMQVQMFQQEKMASIGQMAAGVAHEINNPIGFISSNLGTLKKYFAKIDEYLTIIDRDCIDALSRVSAERTRLKIDYVIKDTGQLIDESLDGTLRVKNIVNDLTNLSRPDQVKPVRADLNRCLESALNIACNEIKYVADVERYFGDIPEIVCHPQQISQVFINLLTNAGQAIEEHGIITIRTWLDHENLYVSVADTGKGIPEDIRTKIFDPFFTTKEVGKGTGLGLSISYDIIHKHGGDIYVESEYGHGTTFIVRLPIRGFPQDGSTNY
ncbi:MAG: response regulator [Desulfuromonadaceae bacterium]|nr:response regulator [Desulfuromonadaceae bacterium]